MGESYIGKLLTNIISSTPYDFEELKAFWGFGDELEELRRSIVAIADPLQRLEANQIRSFQMKKRLLQLKQVAYEAHDLLSHLSYQTTTFKIQSIQVRRFYLNLGTNRKKAGFRVKIVHGLKTVTQKLRNILDECFLFPSEDILLVSSFRRRKKTYPDNGSPVVGREADVAKIVNVLRTFSYQQVTIVPIIGMAGIGKTTLAKLVSQEASERNLFDFYMWANVTDDFDERRIFEEMFVGTKKSLTTTYEIRQQVGKELAGKRFLLVLDDVWNDVSAWWDHFKTWLLEVSANSGNAVIVTTRSNQVASTVEASTQRWYTLGLLSDNECWSIMKNMRNGTFTLNLEQIGRDIAKKCRGLPLVAAVLGRNLMDSIDKKYWLKIRNSTVLNIEACKYGVMPSLQQSFDLLPSYVKPCFVLCSMFPKDFPIIKEELIQLWRANGFVESCNEGNKYFNVLLASSLFQDAERDDDGDVVQFKMHDCMHDLALFLSKYDIRTPENRSNDSASSIQYLYADSQFATTSMNGVEDMAKQLRTIILDGAPYQESWELTSLRTLHMNGADVEVLPTMDKMKHLRYLHISNSTIKELPRSIVKLYNLQTLELLNSDIKELSDSIGKLHNLQTLNVSNSNIKNLPESIGQLYNLQMLNVSNSDIIELPESILKLNNLQTLKFLECKELTKLPREKIHTLISLKHIAFSYEHHMPLGLGQLSRLETFTCFFVGPNRGGSIEELECLHKLSGHLKITRLEEVGDKKEAERANLPGKPKLQGLSLEWSCGVNDRSSSDEEVMEGLRPHENIRRIKVKNYMGEKWPSWMWIMKNPTDSYSSIVLHRLVDLSLTECRKCVRLPRLGDLPNLKFLQISHMVSVKCINYEFYGIDSIGSSSGFLSVFPALKSLSLSWMDNLTDWSSLSDVNRLVFPCLENLSIQSCARLTGFPVNDLSALVNLDIKDCEEFRFVFGRQSFPSLTSLSIEGCPKLTYLRNWLPLHIKDLSFRRCEWLTFIPEDLGKLSSLTTLEIYCCKRLRCFSEEILSKLSQLKCARIGAFSKKLDDFHYLNRIKDLTCLEELEIWGPDFFGRQMCFLPNQLQHLTVLKSLKIMGFTTMEALPEWLTNRQSLQSLSLDNCRHLAWESTPTITQNLGSLMHININCCPILEESKSEWLLFLDTTNIKVEFSHVSKVRVRLGY
ncbi:LRR and NB-ARC domains-containing disease resistance protein [Euphorbia peplus]|nr:LRR and NB-ARC domains-containing disease resistance protein [Euphorbia peplus]